MKNLYTDKYEYFFITNKHQVFGVEFNGNSTPLSEIDFAANLGVSEDGTLWAISCMPDPEDGGDVIFWSQSDSVWNKIVTPDHGGVRLCGGGGSSCFYLTSSRTIRVLDIDGNSFVFDDSQYFIDFSYGHNSIYGVFSPKPGGIPQLHYSDTNNLSWQAFSNEHRPRHISVSSTYGYAYGLDDSGSIVLYDGHDKTARRYYFNQDGRIMNLSATNVLFAIVQDVEGKSFVHKRRQSNETLVKTPYEAIQVLSAHSRS